VGAAIAFRLDRTPPRSVAAPVYGAAVLALIALIVATRLLAPEMLSLKQIGDNAAEAQRIFASTSRWWEVKTLLHVLSFGLTLWAMVAVSPVEQASIRSPAATPDPDEGRR
jgi:hypothetical protein